MADFPALNPQIRTYTPAEYPNTPIAPMDSAEIGVRHTNGKINTILRLAFAGISQDTKDDIIAHYSFHARFASFDLTATTLLGSGITVPAGYQWIYVGPPAFEEVPGVITASVELEMVLPLTL